MKTAASLARALELSPRPRETGLRFIKTALALDRLGRTRHWLSFKCGPHGPLPAFRYWNVEADSYSARGLSALEARLEQWKKTLPWPARMRPVCRAAAEAAEEGLDLFVSLESSAQGSDFGLCLSFGGIDEDGAVRLKPALLARRVVRRCLEALGEHCPALPARGLMHLGIDAGKTGLSFKLYTLKSVWKDHFSFQSRTYRDGRLVGKKLYLEFLGPASGKGAREALEAACRIPLYRRAAARARLVLERCSARPKTLGFEPGGLLTVYLEPFHAPGGITNQGHRKD